MTFLTPAAALVTLAALVPLAAWATGRRRADAVRSSLGLAPPERSAAWRTFAAAGGVVLLGLAAAQPALTHNARVRERAGVEALFVFDTSRSMAASSTPTSRTRLDRAVAAAVRLRAAIPDVPAGVATLTDRVLPDLGPVPDVRGFDSVAERAVAIENPPPGETSVRATTYGALRDVEAGNYFGPKASRRIVVLLTDGESDPVDAGELAASLPADRFVALRFWHSDESVFGRNGERETAYRPDPAGRVLLNGVAAALGGRAFEEDRLAAATAYLRSAVGSGPTTSASVAAPRRTPLAPYLAALALVLLFIAFTPLGGGARVVQSAVR